ncbi:MAG: hypothetical protein IJI47_07400 [Eubacterium sp.]|nr:hypothetical protein [Eubacterium sp.]
MFKRYVSFAVAVALLFAGALGRIGYIIFSGAYTVSQGYNSYAVTVDANEVQLYYRGGEKINNNVQQITAIIRPVTADLAAIQNVYSPKQIKSITAELSEGYPVVHTISTKETSLKTFDTYQTDTTLKQFISRDSSGFLQHIDGYKRELKVSYHIDAKGRLLSGDNGTADYGNYLSREGYIMTFDRSIQQVAFNAAKTINKGCVLVFDANNAELLACVTKPSSTYVNKPVNQYCVGSVFKVVIAACALENGVDINYNCTGSIKVGDTVFSCQKHRAHVSENLETALANSCNCYFANLALNLGADKILATAKRLGFDGRIDFCDNWSLRNSHLPTRSDLASDGELALLGFGQGKLTATPVQIGAMLCAVANGGKYNMPTVVKAKKERNGSTTEIKKAAAVQAVSTETANTLCRYLRTAVYSGTAYSAETADRKAAGKTGTAQTGQYKHGTELCNTWFAGIYPYDNPKCCIVVMCEEGRSGAEDCCPVFRTVVENLEE